MRKPLIYKIINTETEDFYLGSSTNFKKRKTEHLYDLRHNCHHSKYLQNAWNKYGEDKFEFIIFKDYKAKTSNKDLKSREQNYIDKFNPVYNVNRNASGWCNDFVPVVQLSVTDKIIKYYPSIMQANIELGIDPYNVGITSMTHGRQNSAHGYKWVDNRERKSREVIIEESKKRNEGITPVQQIDLITGEVINEGYAQKFTELGFDSSAIRKVMKGEYSNHKGYFFRKYEPYPEKKYFLGVDSGKKGAFVLLDKSGTIAYKTPIFINDSNEYDLDRINKYIYDYKDYIFKAGLEEVHSIFGTTKSTAFKMGFGLGILKGIFVANNLDTLFPAPKEWQNVVWEEIVYEKGSKKTKDTKATSLVNANRIFPEETFLSSSRSSNPHDGLVDAALIAYYIKLKFNG